MDTSSETLYTVQNLKHFRVLAKDASVGIFENIFFDDRLWHARYIITSIGGWLNRKHIAILTKNIKNFDIANQTIHVDLNYETVKFSPTWGINKTMTTSFETELHHYYKAQPYWKSGELAKAAKIDAGEKPRRSAQKDTGDGWRLWGCSEIAGFGFAARDGEFGHVEDVVVDLADWVIRYLEVDTRNWLPGKKTLLNLAWVNGIDGSKRLVDVDITRKAIETAPSHDDKSVITRDYETELFQHYGKAQYWSD